MDIEHKFPVAVDIEDHRVSPDGAQLRLTWAPGGAVELVADVDFGELGQAITIGFDYYKLLKFARAIENHGRIRLGEHVLDWSTPHGGRVIVREVLDEQTVIVSYPTGGGTSRVSVSHLHRLFREEGQS